MQNFQFEQALPATDFSKKSAEEQIEEFRLLDMLTKSQAHEKRLYTSKSLRPFNRYTDILTFNETRVVLKMKQSPNNDTDYINACYIDVSMLK